MARLFGYFANQADRVRCALGRESVALRLSESIHSDGWGVGSYQGGEVLLRRKPTEPRESLRLLDLLHGLRTDCAIVHVRSATVGPRTLQNTHPFRYRQWLFAHNGTLPGFAARRSQVLAEIPDFLARGVLGDTDSEAVFHLFLGFVHKTGRLDDPEFDRASMATALRGTVEVIDRTVGAGQLNLVVTNGHAMVALRRGLPLFWVRRQGLRDCAECRKPPEASGAEPKRVDHDALRYVLVASDQQIEGDGWHEVPASEAGACIGIDRQLAVQTTAF